MDAREKYTSLAKKKKLPKLEDLERVFAFKLSKDSEDFYFDIIKGIEESIVYARHVLEGLLFLHEGSLQSQIYEANFLKKNVLEAYKKLMELKWKYRKVYFNTTPESCEEFIKESYKIWTKHIHGPLLELCNNLERAWKFYKRKQEKQNYVG